MEGKYRGFSTDFYIIFPFPSFNKFIVKESYNIGRKRALHWLENSYNSASEKKEIVIVQLRETLSSQSKNLFSFYHRMGIETIEVWSEWQIFLEVTFIGKCNIIFNPILQW